MDHVAQQTQQTKGTLYLYFQSKDELHFAIMERGMAILMRVMEKRMSNMKNGRETLRGLGLALVEFSNRYPVYFNSLIFFQARDVGQQNLNESKVKSFMANRNSLTLLNETLIRGMEDGSIRKDIPLAELSTTLWAQMMGILVIYSAKKMVFDLHSVNREQLVNRHLDLIRDALIPSRKEDSDHA